MQRKQLIFNIIVMVFLLGRVSLVPLQAQPYKNAKLSPELRAVDLLQRMNLEEKVAQIRHIHSGHIFDGQMLNEEKLKDFVQDKCWGFVEGFPLTGESCHQHLHRIQEYMLKHTRLGIPIFTIGESLHGSVHEGSVIYPQNIALAATFNPSLAYQKSAGISAELHYQGIRQVLGPCIDVVRDMRWGRVEESYGEDPFLNAILACEEVRGYLDNGISPMLKHYGPHGNPTGGLNLASVHCGIGELHDVYLYPFKRVITTLPIQAVMSTYNSWNRIPNSASYYLLTEVLRRRWGFGGYVYSDWGAIDMLHTFHHTASTLSEAAVQALTAGLDVEASSECYPYLVPLIEQGKVDEALVDTAVYRVLLAKFRIGLFENPYGKVVQADQLHVSENRQLARRIADESVVLLKNDGDLLPLVPSKLKSIAVIGPNADQVQFGDYTWSRDNKDGVTPLAGIRSLLAGTGVQVRYAKGCSIMSLDTTNIAAAVAAARASDVAVLFCGSASASLARNYREVNCGEGFDLTDLSLSGAQEKLIRDVHATGKPLISVMVTGKPFSIPWEKKHVPTILVQWYAGEQGGNAVADILFGKTVPSGRLPVSFPQSAGHLPAHYNYLPTDHGYYRQPGSYEVPGRDYVFSSPEPLWAFGHGLSYTVFDYEDMKIEQREDSIMLSVCIRNIGERAGQVVPQLYVRDLYSSVVTPVKQLKAFAKVFLKPKETIEVSLNVAIQDLAFTNNQGKMVLESGDFELQVGDSSDKIFLRDTVQIGFQDTTYQVKETVLDTMNSCGEAVITVKGIVRDTQATPIQGVNIFSTLQKKILVVTDKDGKYEIKVQSNDILIFHKKNYLEEKIFVNGKPSIQITIRNGI